MIDSFDGDYEFLSNFYVHPVTVWGKTYASTEHAFQAAKATNDADHEKVRRCGSPGQAKRMGRAIPCRADWDRVKEDVMLDCLRAKFAPGSELAERLLTTGSKKLVEGNHWGDVYWGVCRGKGKNRLGHLLMLVRSELQEAV